MGKQVAIANADRKGVESSIREASDRNAADRLVNNQKIKNPDRSQEWILEKVIFHLTRDRY